MLTKRQGSLPSGKKAMNLLTNLSAKGDSISLTPLSHPISARVLIPASKSYMNRFLLIGALTPGSVLIHNPLYSDDTQAMIECLRALGVSIECKRASLVIEGDLFSRTQEKEYDLCARSSGTTARFLLPILSLLPGKKILRGTEQLAKRPIAPLVTCLQKSGARIQYLDRQGSLPLQIEPSLLSADRIEIDSDLTSQFLSALLLSSPYFHKEITLAVSSRLSSSSYVAMTLQAMKEAGVTVLQNTPAEYLLLPGQTYQKKEYIMEGDFSSAGYFFAIGALTRSKMTAYPLRFDSLQGDRKLLDFLAQMGNEILYGQEEITIQGRGVTPLKADMQDCPDLVPTLAVLAAFAQGVTHLSGTHSLYYKESNRILALKQELGKMGICAQAGKDSLTIYGGNPTGAIIDTYDDHRVAMSFAVAGLYKAGIEIREPYVVNKTFPQFWQLLESL